MNVPPQWWGRKVLLNLLHGTPPMYRLYASEFKAHRDAIAQTHRLLSPWGRRVGYDEMISHRFVTADRLVQETRFSSGAGICVNFGRTPFKVSETVVIPAEGYVMFTWRHGGGEVYDPPVAVDLGQGGK